MDDSRVRIAVITPITEKTPMLIPNRVSEERNLFLRIASIAIQKLSLNIFFRFLEAITYSYLNESIGSKFAARYDGINPDIIPTVILISIA